MSELPTWRTLIKDRRQSWSAPWWSLWKTSGCSSSRMASTLLKKVMWFCCRNSCMFKWTRPCRSPAIMGRCLGRIRRKNTQLLVEQRVLTDINTIPILCFFFFTWAEVQDATQPASYTQGWHQIHDSQQTWSLLYQQAAWPGDAPGHRAEKNKHKYCAVKNHRWLFVWSRVEYNNVC